LGEDYRPYDDLADGCRDYFGLRVTQREMDDGWVSTDGDDATAHMILAVSPSADDTWSADWTSPCYWAVEAVLWDVIFLARERGWYTPPPDEEWSGPPGGTSSTRRSWGSHDNQ